MVSEGFHIITFKSYYEHKHQYNLIQSYLFMGNSTDPIDKKDFMLEFYEREKDFQRD